MYGDIYLLHFIRKMGGSHKRFCPGCRRKWVGRSRTYNHGGVFVFVLLSGITVMFGFFQLSGSIQQSLGKAQENVTGGLYQQALQGLSSNPAMQEQIKKLTHDPNVISKIQQLKNNPGMLEKLKKFGGNPAALAAGMNINGMDMNNISKMSGYSNKEMMEKASKYLERHQ